MTTNNPTSPREELARIIDALQGFRDCVDDRLIPARDVVEEYERDELSALFGEAIEILSRPPVKAASPEGEEVEAMIERLLDAQQDINFAANSKMDQSLCDASALIDEVESLLRRLISTPPPPERAEVVASQDEREAVARIIAEALGDSFDHACADKAEWVSLRGIKGGRFRDVNEATRGDYLSAADAILARHPATPAYQGDVSSLIAARCLALPGKLIDCPVCGAVDKEREAQAVGEITEAAIERAARAHDREDAAQKGEPSPWTHANCDGEVVEADCEDCKAFRDERLSTMRVALTAAFAPPTNSMEGG